MRFAEDLEYIGCLIEETARFLSAEKPPDVAGLLTYSLSILDSAHLALDNVGSRAKTLDDQARVIVLTERCRQLRIVVQERLNQLKVGTASRAGRSRLS